MWLKATDKELVVAVQSGDIAAFEMLVRRYQKRLHVYAVRFVGSHQSADEVVQDALFKLYQTIDRVDASRKLSSYVYTITKHTAISYLRSHRSLLRLNEMIAQEEKADFSHIYDAVDQLSASYRSVIKLYYFDELSYKEISSKLRVPINTVRTYLFRAKKLLKERLKIYETT